jgi:glutamyl-tRNA reductase
MQLNSLTFAYPDTPGEIRAEITTRLAGSEAPAETFLLSTCLRIEVLVAGDRRRLDEVAAELLGIDDPTAHGVVLSGEQAVAHIFGVAAGLESPILGEREILTQFRQALAAAEESGSVTGLFAKLLETAVSVGRQARELLPDSPHDSMAAVAAQVVGAFDRVAVLGSGLMAQSVVMGLFGLPAPPEVTVVARTPENVTIPGVEVWPMSRAAEAIGSFPAVVSATSAKQRLIPDDELAAALGRRRGTVMLVDMAMPPDLLPPDGAPVTYVDIDHLASKAARRARRHDADAMVAAAAADAYRRFTDHYAVGPVIGGLMRTADDIVDRAVDRFAGRLGGADDAALLRQAAHTVARTLLAAPVSYLRSSDRPAEAVDMLAEAFGQRKTDAEDGASVDTLRRAPGDPT